jgi:hypothetical protein
VCREVFRVFVTGGDQPARGCEETGQLTLRDEGMHCGERGMLRVFGVRAADEVLKQEQVARAALHDREEPVPELEAPTALVRLLAGNICGECGLGGLELTEGRHRGRKRGHERVVEREVREVCEQERRERWRGRPRGLEHGRE